MRVQLKLILKVNMGKVITEPTVYLVNGVHYETVKTRNGIIDSKDLQRVKEKVVLSKLRYVIDDVVTHAHEYPKAKTNTAMTEIKADFVIIQRDEYEELIKQIEDNE